MAFINDIGTAVPNHQVTQSDFSTYYSGLFEDERTKRMIRFICDRSGINTRFSVVDDLDRLHLMSLQEKMQMYHEHASKLAVNAVKAMDRFDDVHSEVTDIITVSCTGMKAPGIEFDIINEFGLKSNIRRYNINFMGCYAALIAIRLARDICRQPNRTVLVTAVELCTLHFQPSDKEDYLLSNSLFADGAASVLISSEPIGDTINIKEFSSSILPQSSDDMGWEISQHGFLMKLSKSVPSVIKDNLAWPVEFDSQSIRDQWAVHPGGRQILETVESCFELTEHQMSDSYNVLKNNGNMSSCTVLFILKAILESRRSVSGKNINVCAFGPGLTFESMQLEYA